MVLREISVDDRRCVLAQPALLSSRRPPPTPTTTLIDTALSVETSKTSLELAFSRHRRR